MTISEKVAYLKGLAEGLAIDTEKSKEGKLISVMIGILEEIGLSIEDLEENTVALGEEIDALSDDLSEVEEAVFEEDDEDEDDDCCCEDDFFETECPNCGEKHYIFGKSNLEQVAAELQVKVLAQIPMDPAMAAAMDQGAMETMEHNYLEPVADAILAHEQG